MMSDFMERAREAGLARMGKDNDTYWTVDEAKVLLDFLAGVQWAVDHLSAQGPDDAEIEAALAALLISECIVLGQTADEAADYAIRELETRDLANLRTGVRCALRYARAARAAREFITKRIATAYADDAAAESKEQQ